MILYSTLHVYKAQCYYTLCKVLKFEFFLFKLLFLKFAREFGKIHKFSLTRVITQCFTYK